MKMQSKESISFLSKEEWAKTEAQLCFNKARFCNSEKNIFKIHQ